MKPPKAARGLRKGADRYHHGDLRESLIAATLDLVRREGPEGVTLRAVAGKAGVSGAAPYHHFQDKTELLAAAAAASFGMLRERLERVIQAPSRETREGLVALGVEWVRFALEEPGAFRLTFGAHVEALVRFEEARRAGQQVKALVAGAVGEWCKGREGVDAPTVFRSLWAQVHGVAWLSLEKEFGASFGKTQTLALARTGLNSLLDGFDGPDG